MQSELPEALVGVKVTHKLLLLPCKPSASLTSRRKWRGSELHGQGDDFAPVWTHGCALHVPGETVVVHGTSIRQRAAQQALGAGGGVLFLGRVTKIPVTQVVQQTWHASLDWSEECSWPVARYVKASPTTDL